MFRLRKMVVVVVLYKVVLELLYVFDVSKVFGYYGLTVNMNVGKSAISYLLIIALLILSPKNERLPSTFFYFFIMVFTVVPLFSFYWLNDQDSTYIVMVFISMLLIRFVLCFPRIKIHKTIIKREFLVTSFLVVVYATLYIAIFFTYGLPSVKSLSFSDIYSLRQERRLVGFLGYAVNWLAKVVNPFLILVFVDRKRPIAVGVIGALQLTLYAVFGYKAFLLSIGAIFGCVFLMRRDMFSGALVGVLTTVNVLSNSNISVALTTLIPFRMVFLPAVIQYWYYEFFSVFPKLNFSEGVLGKIFGIDSPYYERGFDLIGIHYRGFAHTVNSGMFGDAYANGGFYAMLVIALLFGVMAHVFDSITTDLPIYFSVSSMAYMMFVLNDTGLLTSLLTGGFILMLVLMYFYSSRFRDMLS